MMFCIHKKNGFFVGDVYIHEKDLNTVHVLIPKLRCTFWKDSLSKASISLSQVVDPLSKVAVW